MLLSRHDFNSQKDLSEKKIVSKIRICSQFRSQYFRSRINVEASCSHDMFLDSHKGLNEKEIASKIRRDDFDGLVQLLNYHRAKRHGSEVRVWRKNPISCVSRFM